MKRLIEKQIRQQIEATKVIVASWDMRAMHKSDFNQQTKCGIFYNAPNLHHSLYYAEVTCIDCLKHKKV